MINVNIVSVVVVFVSGAIVTNCTLFVLDSLSLDGSLCRAVELSIVPHWRGFDGGQV